MPADSEITRISIDTEKSVRLISGGRIDAVPINSWRSGGLFVTAVQLRNLSQQTMYLAYTQDQKPESNEDIYPHVIDLKIQLRGKWLAVSRQHSYMEAAGTPQDRTVVYLLSRRPFMEALNG